MDGGDDMSGSDGDDYDNDFDAYGSAGPEHFDGYGALSSATGMDFDI